MTTTSEQMVQTIDGSMRVFEATPEGEAKGALIVIMEAFGLNEHIEDVTRRAADAGYHAIAPDFFHRAGGQPASYEDFERVMELFQGVTRDTVLNDAEAAMSYLAAAGFSPSSVSVTGFCWGGWAAFLLASQLPLRAAVTWYGGGIVNEGLLGFPTLVHHASSMATPWLGLFGDLDGSIPPAEVEELRTAVAAAPVETEIVRYADAEHGFHCDARPANYNADAAADGWQRMLRWLDR